MNDQTTQLLQQLATKLGTTSEYLWGVLIKQAPIWAGFATGLIVVSLIGSIVFGFLTYKFCIKASENDKASDFLIGCISCIFLTICTVCFLVNLGEIPLIIAGFNNPEYWALKQIIK